MGGEEAAFSLEPRVPRPPVLPGGLRKLGLWIGCPVRGPLHWKKRSYPPCVLHVLSLQLAAQRSWGVKTRYGGPSAPGLAELHARPGADGLPPPGFCASTTLQKVVWCHRKSLAVPCRLQTPLCHPQSPPTSQLPAAWASAPVERSLIYKRKWWLPPCILAT